MWIASLRVGIAFSLLVTCLPPPSSLPTKEVGWDARRSAVMAAHDFGFRSRSDAALAEWALTRFDRAGLVLPPLVLSFYDDRADCADNFGLYRSGAPVRVDICGFNWDRFVTMAKKTVLHELAHAWIGHTLSETAQENFLDLRGLNTWGDDEFPWAEQGSEQAAEILAWALMDEGLELTKFKSADPAALSQAYRHLTGSLPTLRIPVVLHQHRAVSP